MVSKNCQRDMLRNDGLGANIYNATDTGELSEEETRLRTVLIERDKKTRKIRANANRWRVSRGKPPKDDFKGLIYIDHAEPMILTSLNTGLRRGELFSLEWGDVDFERNMLTVKATNAKSNKTRHLPLNSEVIDVLTQ